MRMIALTAPRSDIRTLAGLGQQIKAALKKGLVVTDGLILDEFVLDTVVKAYEGRKSSDFEKKHPSGEGACRLDRETSSEQRLPSGYPKMKSNCPRL